MPKDLSEKFGADGSAPFQIPSGLGNKGTYTLLIFVQDERKVCVGSLGEREFPRGFYAYTGSAFGKGASSLLGRISRHLRKAKKKRWHIDYLLSGSRAVVTAIVAGYTGRNIECEINRHLQEGLRARFFMPGFGSSDCRENCMSHLLYLGSAGDFPERIMELYSEKTDGSVQIIDPSKSSIFGRASTLC